MPALTAIFGGDASKLKRELASVETMAKATGDSLKHHLAAGVAGVVSVEGVKSIIEYGDKVSTLAQRLGISTDAVQQWDYALKMSDSSIEAAVPFFEKLASARQKAMEGSPEQIAAFQRLGVTIDDLKNKRLEDIGLQIARAFQGGDPQKLIADLREVGGRGAGEMVAAFRDGLADAADEASKAGVIIGNSVIEQLREAADASKQIWMEFVAGAAPAVAWLTTTLKKLWQGLNVAIRGAVGFASGGVEGAKDLMNEYADEEAKKEAAAKEKRETARKPLTGGAEEDSEKIAAHEAKKEEDLQDKLDKIREKNAMKQMSRDEKLAKLQELKQQAEEVANSPFLSKQEQLQAAIKAEEYQSEIEGVGEDKRKMLRGKLTSNQQIGAYAPAATLIDVNKRMEGHLAGIHRILGGKRSTGGDSGRTKY